jgi:hypothetical protein
MQCSPVHIASIFRVEVTQVWKVAGYVMDVRKSKGHGGQG